MIIDLPLKIDVIKQTEANLHTILDNAETGYVLYNAELSIIAYNALAQQYSQLLYKKDLEEGCHLLQYFPEYRHFDLLNTTAKVLSGEKISYETCFIIDNAELWIEVTWLHVKNTGNKNWGFILTSKDITATKQAAIKLEKMTIDLLNRNKALEQFGNIVSHNLRAPVANIINIVQMIDIADSEDEKKLLLDFILSSSQVLVKVIGDINQILEIKQHLHEVKEKIYLETLLNEIKTTINYMIIKENVIISSDFNDVPHIFSTRSFIYSIYYNLVLNSIKYRRVDVTPEIDLSAKISGDKIILKFTDNGKGIDLCKNGHNLFGLYKRFDTTVEGSGLGLFMIKTQIEQLGGTINVESELDKGTTFTIELPK